MPDGLQFKVLNTVNDQLLTNVSVGFVMEPEDVWQVHSVVPLKELAYGKTGNCYVCLQNIGDGVYPVVQVANEVCLIIVKLERNSNASILTFSIAFQLKFKVHEVNPSTGEAEDDVRSLRFPF